MNPSAKTPPPDSEKNATSKHLTLSITGMTCANCVNTVERTLNKKVPGVVSASVNFATEKASITYQPDQTTPEALLAAIERAGYGGILPSPATDHETAARNAEIREQSIKLWVGLIFTGLIFLISHNWLFLYLTSFGLNDLSQWQYPTWVNWTLLLLALPVQVYTGSDYYVSAYKSLRNRAANMDVLVALGSSTAYLYSVVVTVGLLGGPTYFETAATIITLIKVGKLLEARAKGRTSAALKGLLSLQAKTAQVQRGGQWEEVPLEAVQVGDVLQVKPGSIIPVDGRVLSGQSAVDESLISGESMPVQKEPGAEVIGATINQYGLLTMQAERVGAETTLAQIIRLVETAQGSKAPIQALADRVAAVFVPIVIGLALLSFGLWLVSGASFTVALMRLVAVLVIACPCALGLATPTALVVGMGHGAQQGILFRHSEALERASGLNVVLLDKTGTLTKGQPALTDTLALTPAYSPADLLRLAATAEQGSEHPLGVALVKAAQADGLSLGRVLTLQAEPGFGLQAQIQADDQASELSVLVGNSAWLTAQNLAFTENNENTETAQAQQATLSAEGKSTVWLAVEGEVVGLFGLADTLKPSAGAAVSALQALGMQVALLTGDNQRTAESIAAQLQAETPLAVIAEVRPGEKQATIQRLQAEGQRVAMVGDGLNDAPALMQADVGFAIGTGADVAVESAGITLLGDDVRGVGQAIRLSRATMCTIKQNLFWAFAYNVLLIPIAMGVLAPFESWPIFLRQLHPIAAAFAMAMSSIMVVGNSLRLQKKVLGGKSKLEAKGDYPYITTQMFL